MGYSRDSCAPENPLSSAAEVVEFVRGLGRGSGSVGGLSGRNAGGDPATPASDALHNPWLISPPINGFEESRLGCDMRSLESSCFFELCGVHAKAHAQASEDRQMACERCDLLRPERLYQK
jgi:hypothetical protein